MQSLARYLMGTRFELVIADEGEPAHLRAAGEEALDEVERLERQLSLYRADSDISAINARAGKEWVQLDPRLFTLLKRAVHLSRETDGGFDLTVTPLMRAWGFLGARGAMAAEENLNEARGRVGWRHIELDEERFAIRFDVAGASLDLGAIGKGYAVEQAMALLQEAGVKYAILHAGTSTVAALGAPPDRAAWRIAVANPAEEGKTVATIELEAGQALSVSGTHGKCFTAPDGTIYGHVLDPRVGRPVIGARLAVVVSGSPTDSDALSTALLVLASDHDPVTFLSEHAATAVWEGASLLVESREGAIGARGPAFPSLGT
ncbi:MAG TPA: FAD:protein FMN transferase [Armatimonadota bacterium]|nr:FAD:protein FMN transferase [Armatimonadota bacterium]